MSKEYEDLTDDEKALDDYLCSEEHLAYFQTKLKRGLRLPDEKEDE